MEKMNQVSVSEFFAKSKEEMYDMAVEMVEKYNRLVDICNDSCERIADLVTERDNLREENVDLRKGIVGKDNVLMSTALYNSMVDENEKLKADLMHEREKYEKLEKEFKEYKEDHEGINAPIPVSLEKVFNLKEEVENLEDDITALRTANRILVEKSKEHLDEIKKLKETIKNKDIVIKMYYNIRVRQAKSICALKKELEGAKCNIGDRDSVMDGLYAEIERRQTENNTLRHRLHSQEERHANQLNAAADEVEKLKKSFNALQQEMATRYIAIETHNDICKTYEENMEMEGDHGRKGFKEYIKWIVKEEEEKFYESWKAKLNEELAEIFEEEEETEVKGRYPWGAKVRCKKPDGIYCSYSDECHRKPENFNCDFKDDIPCGSDSIE